MAEQGRDHLLRLRVALPPDPETQAWTQRWRARPHSALVQTLHRSLGRFASDWDVNALLGTYPVHLLGPTAWAALLPERPGGRLLDVGAGNGDVSATLAPFFDALVPVETSAGMARRLRQRFGRCERIDLGRERLEGEPFDAIALLNVLDRCERPRTLLDNALRALRPGGLVLLASPLPARPHVDAGGVTVDPDEPFDAQGADFEEALFHLVERELRPRGVEPLRWARADYLSRGDSERALYVHDDVVLIARSAGARA